MPYQSARDLLQSKTVPSRPLEGRSYSRLREQLSSDPRWTSIRATWCRSKFKTKPRKLLYRPWSNRLINYPGNFLNLWHGIEAKSLRITIALHWRPISKYTSAIHKVRGNAVQTRIPIDCSGSIFPRERTCLCIHRPTSTRSHAS